VTKNEYLTIRQAANLLSIPEPVLRLTIRCGKINSKYAKGKSRIIVRREDLQHFIDPLQEKCAG
jgi:hypothetical protein